MALLGTHRQAITVMHIYPQQYESTGGSNNNYITTMRAMFGNTIDVRCCKICSQCVGVMNIKGNVKSSVARSLPVENLLPQNVGLIINYLQ